MMVLGEDGNDKARAMVEPPATAQAIVQISVNSWLDHKLKMVPVTIENEEEKRVNARPAGSFRRKPKVQILSTRKIKLSIEGRTR